MDGSKIPPTGQVTVALNLKRYETLATQRGWTTNGEHARALQVGEATISRMRTGLWPPGSRLIAALRRAFPDEPFDDLFTIVPLSDVTERRAS